jgi:hypothetical protein
MRSGLPNSRMARATVAGGLVVILPVTSNRESA